MYLNVSDDADGIFACRVQRRSQRPLSTEHPNLPYLAVVVHRVLRARKPLRGLSEMAYFIFGYFSTKLGTSVDGHEK
jgi:hypothetical protein